MPVVRLVKRVIPIGECIYCGEEKEFSREHYLPECLGRFKNFETLDDRVCRECNNRIGRELEDQFCRAGEVGFLRYGLGIEGKKRKEAVNPFERGSSGSSPLMMKAKIPGQGEEVRLQLVKGTREGRTVHVDYIPQVILTTEAGETHHILLTNMTKPEELKEKIDALKIEKVKQINVVATADERELVEGLTSFLPEVKATEWEDLPMSGKTFTQTEYEVTDRYFRAIAKIAFHYALKHFRHFRGDEEMFEGIRNFIMNGGNIQDFVRWSKKQIVEIKPGYSPSTFAHVIHARANEQFVWSRLQFFIGPQTIPLVYRVALAVNKPILSYDIMEGHSFCYYEEGIKDGFAGVMDQLLWIHKAPAQAKLDG
jgi:hypothetical protein